MLSEENSMSKLKKRLHAISIVLAGTLCAQALGKSDTITLIGGDVLLCTIVSESETSVTVDHPALGRIELSRERIESIVRTAPPVPEAAATVAAAATHTPPPAAEPAPAIPVAVLPAPAPPAPAKPDGSWRFNLTLAASGSESGDQSNRNIRIASKASRESESDRTTVTGEYFFQSADSSTTQDNLLVQGVQDFLFTDSRWEIFTQANYQYDSFQAWEKRAGAYAGPGYRLIENESIKLKVRAGLGASFEFPTSDWTPEVLLADGLVWTIDTRSSLIQGFELYPDLDNAGEYRFIARIDYEIKLTEKGDLKGVAGVRDEYDSYVESDQGTSNDLKVYLGIGLDF